MRRIFYVICLHVFCTISRYDNIDKVGFEIRVKKGVTLDLYDPKSYSPDSS
jgi:hypothetical protein